MQRKTYKLRPEDEFTTRFYGLLGRLVHAHAQLDFNVGLQLNWMGPHLGTDVSGLLQGTVPFARRLTKLEELTAELFVNSEAALMELKAWFQAAGRPKRVRNDFVHGRWGVPRSAFESPPRIELAPLHWTMDADALEPPIVMTINELEQEVAALQHLAGEHFRLMRKHERWAISRLRLLLHNDRNAVCLKVPPLLHFDVDFCTLM
jgi:hypothetical protein